MRLHPSLRLLPSAMRSQLVCRGYLIALIVSPLFGYALPNLLTRFLPPNLTFPYTAIAASYLIDFTGLAVLFAMLNSSDKNFDPWLHAGAWIGCVLFAGGALAGLALAKTHGESSRTFVVLWLLFTAQAAVTAAICGMLRLLSGAQRFALQATMLLLGIAITALFWSREPITLLSRGGGEQRDNGAADRLAVGVVKLSPPMTLAAAWNQECDAARLNARGTRFDLIRAPLTYEVWIGSYQALPYPDIMPARQSAEESESGERKFTPGIMLAMLLWGLPLIVLSDVLLFMRAKPN